MRFEEIYLDMDGVIADFVHAFMHIHKRMDLAHNLTTRCLEEVLGITQEECWAPIVDEKHYFWDEIPIFPWAIELYQFCRQIGPVTFLSRPICLPELNGRDTAYCVRGKLTWLRRNFGQEIDEHDVIFTGRKESVAKPGVLLVDDDERYELKFRERGARQIVFPACYNRFRARWDEPMDCVHEQYEGLLEE